MKPQTAERWLTILFRLNALLLTSAFLALFLTNSMMQSIHQWLGLGDMPEGPVVEYLARSCSMLYFVHGLVLGYVSLNMRKYRELVPLLAALHLVLGVVVLGIDVQAGMPWYWTLAEGPGIILFACLLLALWFRANQSPAALST
jgi:hypothetical protein